jgi:hypothetical protein
MIELGKSLTTRGEKYIVNQAIVKTDYVQEGFVNEKGEKNYFRYNNAYLDERLKMLYNFPTQLYKAYSQSGAFDVFSESEFCVYTEKEINEVRNSNVEKAKRIKLLHEIFQRMRNPKGFFDLQTIEALRNDFALFFEAFEIIGFQKIKKLKFLDSAIKKAVDEHKLKERLATENVIADVYSLFKVGEIYTVKFIKDELQKIFDKHKVSIDRKAKTKDITFYFKVEDARKEDVRQWKMLSKRQISQ